MAPAQGTTLSRHGFHCQIWRPKTCFRPLRTDATFQSLCTQVLSCGTYFCVGRTSHGILLEETDDDSENLDDQATLENAFSEELKNIWALEIMALDDDDKN